MPNIDGALTDAEFQTIALKLHELWGGRRKPCASCGHEKYYIHPSLLGNRSDTLSPLGAHTRLPTVGVYCQKCGSLEQYVARILGIDVLSVNAEASDG